MPAQACMAARPRRAALIPWWLFIQRKSSGATRPAKFPTEFIQAMPAAAAVPERMAVGTDQKHEVVDITRDRDSQGDESGPAWKAGETAGGKGEGCGEGREADMKAPFLCTIGMAADPDHTKGGAGPR